MGALRHKGECRLPRFSRTPALAKGFERKILNEEKLTNATALGRLAEPTEIATAVGFLASPLASAITGVNLTVDAGYFVASAWNAYSTPLSEPHK